MGDRDIAIHGLEYHKMSACFLFTAVQRHCTRLARVSVTRMEFAIAVYLKIDGEGFGDVWDRYEVGKVFEEFVLN